MSCKCQQVAVIAKVFPVVCGKCNVVYHGCNPKPQSAARCDTRGYDHAAICRSNRCGEYDAENDSCRLVVRIGKEKGQARAGKVSWLYRHPNAACPHDPPMWSVDDGVDTMDARTNQSQRVGDAVGGEEQVRKSR